jgi:hypothetical protein
MNDVTTFFCWTPDSRLWWVGCRASKELRICVGTFMNTNVTHSFTLWLHSPLRPLGFFATHTLCSHLPSPGITSLSALENHPLHLSLILFRVFRLSFLFWVSSKKFLSLLFDSYASNCFIFSLYRPLPTTSRQEAVCTSLFGVILIVQPLTQLAVDTSS